MIEEHIADFGSQGELHLARVLCPLQDGSSYQCLQGAQHLPVSVSRSLVIPYLSGSYFWNYWLHGSLPFPCCFSWQPAIWKQTTWKWLHAVFQNSFQSMRIWHFRLFCSHGLPPCFLCLWKPLYLHPVSCPQAKLSLLPWFFFSPAWLSKCEFRLR